MVTFHINPTRLRSAPIVGKTLFLDVSMKMFSEEISFFRLTFNHYTDSFPNLQFPFPSFVFKRLIKSATVNTHTKNNTIIGR